MMDYSLLKMACLGDSLTFGQGIEIPYSDLVKKELGLSEVYNYGIGWSTIADGIHCYCHPDNFSLAHNPFIDRFDLMKSADILIVCGGVNDHGVNIPLGDIQDTVRTTFYGALNLLIQGLKDRNPQSYIIFMTPFQYDVINADGVHLSVFVDAILRVCEKYGIDCYDCYHEIPFQANTDTIDGVHPTQRFVSEVWAPGIAQFLRDHICN